MDHAPLTLAPAPLEVDAQDRPSGVYAAQPKGYFLARMQRSLSTSGLALLHLIPGTVLHRLLSLPAEQLSRLSHDMRAAVTRAVREGAYLAWQHPELFPPRAPATFAQGEVVCRLQAPAREALPIPGGTLFGTSDGRIVRSLEEATLLPGQTEVRVRVAAEIAGPGGNVPAGAVTRMLSGASLPLACSNPAAVAGGLAEEGDAELYLRFQDYVESRSTGNRLAVYSAARNARVAGERVIDAALVYPWLMEHVNAEMGYGLVFVDSGAGGASSALLSAAQTNVTRVQSSGQHHQVFPADAWVVAARAEVLISRTGDAARVASAVREAWSTALGSALIEDGRGRGRVSLFEVLEHLTRAHPDVVNVSLSLSGDLEPPIGARIVPGVLDAQVRRGELWRP